jgi:hypothetical protein
MAKMAQQIQAWTSQAKPVCLGLLSQQVPLEIPHPFCSRRHIPGQKSAELSGTTARMKLLALAMKEKHTRFGKTTV